MQIIFLSIWIYHVSEMYAYVGFFCYINLYQSKLHIFLWKYLNYRIIFRVYSFRVLIILYFSRLKFKSIVLCGLKVTLPDTRFGKIQHYNQLLAGLKVNIKDTRYGYLTTEKLNSIRRPQNHDQGHELWQQKKNSIG